MATLLAPAPVRPVHYPRAALTALALGAFGIGIAEFAVTGLLPSIAAGFGSSEASVGTAISLYALGVVIGAPLITVAGARVPRQRLLLATVALFAVGNGAAVVAPSIVAFDAARFVAGLPHGAYLALSAATAASLVERERRGRATAFVAIGQTIASILGVPLAIGLGQAVSWRAALALAVVVFVVAFGAILRHVPSRPEPAAAGPRATVRALRNPVLWSGFAITATAFAGIYCVFSYIAPITTQTAGLAAGAIPFVLMAFGVGLTLGAVAGGRLADWDVVRTVPLACLAGVVVLAGFAAVMSEPWAPFAGAFGLGLVLQLLLPSLQLRLMDAAPAVPAVAAAVNQAAISFANVLGTATGGALTAAGLGHASHGYTAAAVAAAAAVLSYLLRPRVRGLVS
ncbi:MFS transporter [Symbioplanes lichenis]|uniref:MFS transporter n=1 Tax=Symbioplanes lichenis TaxID=1629072 RepID=UPI002738695B|nr:MFS transporter [Actinoplanes lichenis]